MKLDLISHKIKIQIQSVNIPGKLPTRFDFVLKTRIPNYSEDKYFLGYILVIDRRKILKKYFLEIKKIDYLFKRLPRKYKKKIIQLIEKQIC